MVRLMEKLMDEPMDDYCEGCKRTKTVVLYLWGYGYCKSCAEKYHSLKVIRDIPVWSE